MKRNFAIFASGSGSNAQNIIEYFEDNQDFNFCLIVSNKSDAYVHQRAKALGIKSVTFDKQTFDEGTKIIETLQQHSVDVIILAGFLLKISSPIIATYPQKILNIHPALLPKYGGKGMYGDRVHKAVVEAGDTASGITIHYVNENYDEGAIIFQAEFRIEPQDDYEVVASKVHALEYLHFPQIIEKIFK